MKKLLAFISFFLSVVVYSQSNNDRLRQTQYNNANSVQDLHSDSNAASDPAGNESSAITGWSSSTSTINIGVTFDANVGSFAIVGTRNTTSPGTAFARIGYSFPCENGETYLLTWDGKESAGADARLYLFTNVNGSQQSMTTTYASYSRTLTATTNGTATVQWVLVSSTEGQQLFIDNVSIIKQ